MVHELVALLVLEPVEHRKVDDPQEGELRPDRAGSRFFASCSRSCPSSLRRRLVRPGGHEHEVGRPGAGELQRAPDRLLARRLQRRALHAAFVGARPHESGRAELLRLLDELVELAARVPRRARNRKAAHLAARRDGRRGTPRTTTRRTPPTGRRSPCRSAGPACRIRTSRSPRRTACGRNGRGASRPMSAISRSISGSIVENTRSSVANEISRSTCVNSGWRSARRSSSRKHLHDLEVAIEPGDHQDLLEDLRRLRQRVELARVHAARHQIVARAFRRRLRQHRRLDLEEALLVEVLPDRPSWRGGAGSCCAASAAAADRGSGTSGASLRTPATRRRSRTAASSRRSAAGSRAPRPRSRRSRSSG